MGTDYIEWLKSLKIGDKAIAEYYNHNTDVSYYKECSIEEVANVKIIYKTYYNEEFYCYKDEFIKLVPYTEDNLHKKERYNLIYRIKKCETKCFEELSMKDLKMICCMLGIEVEL